MENYLTAYFKCPVFVTHWPSKIKSFYMKQCIGNDGSDETESFDLYGLFRDNKDYYLFSPLSKTKRGKMKTLKNLCYDKPTLTYKGISKKNLLHYIYNTDSFYLQKYLIY